MKVDPNENAFPVFGEEGRNTFCHYGLTKREYFAAQAMQGMIASNEWIADTLERVSKTAIEYADALIAELNKEAHNA